MGVVMVMKFLSFVKAFNFVSASFLFLGEFFLRVCWIMLKSFDVLLEIFINVLFKVFEMVKRMFMCCLGELDLSVVVSVESCLNVVEF